MRELPEFVLKYKTKGTAIKFSKGNYYLYKVRSQREEGKKYPVVKSEYIGVITEEKGLVTSHPSINGEIQVLKLGEALITEQTISYLKSVGEFYKQREALLYVRAVLYCFNLKELNRIYEHSYLSILYPNLNIEEQLTENEERTLERLKRQTKDKLKRIFKEDWPAICTLSQYLYAVHVNKKWRNSIIDPELAILATKYNLNLTIKEDKI